MSESKTEYKISTKMLVADRIVISKNIENEKVLLEEKSRQAVLCAKDVCVLKQGGYIVLDFGVEFQGGINVTVQMTTAPNAKIRFTFGESVMESLSEIGEKNATNDHALRDIVLPISNRSNFRVGNTGFRFVKLESINADVEIRGVQGAFEFRDIEYKGLFQCNDELLNQIWKMGAYTVHLNMQEYLWDGIKRDRLVWVGDMHPEVSTICSVFGYDDCVPKSLDLIKNETPCNMWMNNIPSYTMWWIKIQRDWYFQNGDLEYLKEQKDYLFGVLENILSNECDNRRNTIPNDFVDWSSNGTVYEKAGLKSLLIISLLAGNELCEVLHNEVLAKLCLDGVLKLKHYIPEYCGNKQIAALVSLSGLENCRKINDEVLSPNGPKGLSTFLGYYTLQTMANAGNIYGALNVIRDYWGGMIKMGATTFWEDFDLEWTKNAASIDEIVPIGKDDIHGGFGRFCYEKFRHSLCHGWASGPTPFLSHYVLGVEIIEPKCKKIKINPHLGDLKWVKGIYPTPYGKISVEHNLENGKVKSKIEAPHEINVDIVGS